MAPKRALQNIFGTQKVVGGLFYILAPTFKSGGSAPSPCSAAPGQCQRRHTADTNYQYLTGTMGLVLIYKTRLAPSRSTVDLMWSKISIKISSDSSFCESWQKFLYKCGGVLVVVLCRLHEQHLYVCMCDFSLSLVGDHVSVFRQLMLTSHWFNVQ